MVKANVHTTVHKPVGLPMHASVSSIILLLYFLRSIGALISGDLNASQVKACTVSEVIQRTVTHCRACHDSPGSDIRIINQFLITRALHFAQPQAYYQASVTITLGRRV